MTIDQQDPSLHLPRILCLHGGGTNARIFYTQCRMLRKQLRGSFRLCFAEAPFLSEPGSDVSTVYKEFGPFRRWLRWLPAHPPIHPRDAVSAIDQALEAAILSDDAKGATGIWAAVLGFSQGAKVAASLLLRQQARAKNPDGHIDALPTFRFGILLAGRGPLVSLRSEDMGMSALVDASADSLQDLLLERTLVSHKHIVAIPTIHVHGLRDPGLDLHRQLLERYFEKGSTRLVDWDGDHRVPIKLNDVTAVVVAILSVARQTGGLS